MMSIRRRNRSFISSLLLSITTGFVIGFSQLASAQSNQADFKECRQFFPYGKVPILTAKAIVPGKLRALCFTSFAVLYSGQSKTPFYVVEKMNRNSLLEAKNHERTDRFYEEARIPSSERSTLNDYVGSGYDRGHLAPAADMQDASSMEQSFSLANIVPQAPDHNRGIWAKAIESPTRKYVMRAQGDVFVFTTVHYTAPIATVGRGNVWVPNVMIKLVFDAETGRAWAHWSENNNFTAMSKPISYLELFQRTGINFLPDINVMD